MISRDVNFCNASRSDFSVQILVFYSGDCDLVFVNWGVTTKFYLHHRVA